MTIFLCKSGFDGILSGVYDVYASKCPLEECRLELEEEYEPVLFAEYREVPLVTWKAEKVAAKVRNFMSEEAYVCLYRAGLHKNPNRADWILRFTELGLRYGRRTIKMLQKPAVFEIFQMDRYVGREAHLVKEFVRFEKLSSGIYYGKIGPENRVLELIAPHFSDRFPDMNWVIYDEKHNTAAVHSGEGHWMIREQVTEQEIGKLLEQKQQDIYIDMWKVFFETIAIEERKNYKCQRNMLPLRYRKYMTEFQ